MAELRDQDRVLVIAFRFFISSFTGCCSNSNITFILFRFLGDQLAIAKETGRRLGMGTNMYPSSTLLGQDKDSTVAALPMDELIEKADGFAGVFPGAYSFTKSLL